VLKWIVSGTPIEKVTWHAIIITSDMTGITVPFFTNNTFNDLGCDTLL
jgi:hypothetical protein